MSDDTLNLFDFGTNDNGEYVNLVEEEKRLKGISDKELTDWVNKHHDPLIRLAFDNYVSATDIEFGNHKDLQARLESIVATKCYHWAKMNKNLYVFSLHLEDRYIIVFENENHYLVNEPNGWKLDSNNKMVLIPFDDYLLGKETLGFPALYCHCYDINGNRLHQYAEGKDYKNDIRHIVCIKEWQMDKFSKNRINEGKKIKDFYEVEFTWNDFTGYWGESEVENGD